MSLKFSNCHYLQLINSKIITPSKLIDFFKHLNDENTDSILGGSKCEILKDDFFNNYFKTTIVDFGSFETKIGFAYYDVPKIYQSTCKIKNEQVDCCETLKDIFVYSTTNSLSYFFFDNPVVISSPVFSHKNESETIIEIMFESFHVPSFYINTSSVFSLFSYGIETGISVDIGYETTRLSPVFQGHDISLLYKKMNYGGKTINDLLYSNIVINHDHINAIDDKIIIEDVKKKYSYVSLDTKLEKTKGDIYDKYYINQGGFVEISDERYMIPEVFFNPNLYNIKQNGISKEISDIISQIDIDYRYDFYKNIAFLVHLA